MLIEECFFFCLEVLSYVHIYYSAVFFSSNDSRNTKKYVKLVFNKIGFSSSICL